MGDEDTTIGSYTYSKINYCGGPYKGATRTESGKVYYIPKDSTADYLLYDFSVQPGDLIYNVYVEGVFGPANLYPDPLLVTDVSEFTINGIAHKQIFLNEGVSWIEGIGNNTNGLFAGIEILEIFAYTQMDCMSQNDTSLFPSYNLQPCNLTLGNTTAQKNKDLVAYPNPTEHSTTLQWDESLTDFTIQVYNAIGNTFDPVIIYPSGRSAEIDLSIYPKGLYTIVMTNTQKSYTARVIKR